jgi:hypothetical protein
VWRQQPKWQLLTPAILRITLHILTLDSVESLESDDAGWVLWTPPSPRPRHVGLLRRIVGPLAALAVSVLIVILDALLRSEML